MDFSIVQGVIDAPYKVVIYGPEGIGKSTFASQFPDPLFIDTEGSTKRMNIRRFQTPTSWSMLIEQVKYIIQNPHICKSLVIDTIDWAEQMEVEHVCDKAGKNGIEDFGYGNGYVYAKEELGRFLNLLEEVINVGINVILTAHAQIRKFELPDESGAFDRWELKLGKKTASQTSPLVKEWADMVLFVNYKTLVVNVDGKGTEKGKNKAQGGKRVMYTTHHTCWDAKNRDNLPEEMEFNFSSIAHLFINKGKPEPVHASESPVEHTQIQQPAQQHEPEQEAIKTVNLPLTIPKALRDLMIANNVCEWDIQNVVAAKGYYPSDTPIQNYDPEFISGVLVGAWQQVYSMIETMNAQQEIPFN